MRLKPLCEWAVSARTLVRSKFLEESSISSSWVWRQGEGRKGSGGREEGERKPGGESGQRGGEQRMWKSAGGVMGGSYATNTEHRGNPLLSLGKHIAAAPPTHDCCPTHQPMTAAPPTHDCCPAHP